jgi:protease-4
MKISFWRIFWPSFIAIIVSGILFAFSFFGILGGVLASFSGEDNQEVTNKSILKMTLAGQIVENSETNFDPYNLSVENKIGLSDILFGLKKAKEDKNIKGLYLEIKELKTGYATINEIRKGLDDFKKSGKFVLAYNTGEMMSLKQLFLTSITKDNYGFPSTHLEFLGLGRQYEFYANTLSKVGVEMQVVRGEENHFKSAVEPYISSRFSDSAKLQVQLIYNELWSNIKKSLSLTTGVNEIKLDYLAENGLVTTIKNAVSFNIMKGVKYQDEIEELLKNKAGISLFDKIEFYDFEKYAKSKFYDEQGLMDVKKPSIAVILAEGDISVDGKGLSSDKVANYLKEARNDKNIKAIVLRVNSPGGSALASDVIWREVILAKKSKKVIVSMGDVAASGGYYISCAADYIFAEPTTITGSIGVFGVIPYTGKLFEEKLGVTFDEVKTNTHSVLSLNRKLTVNEIDIIQKDVNEIYRDFLLKVSEGRKLDVKKVHNIARGRVWIGSDAIKKGLVDKIGGIDDAINYAAKISNCKTPIVKYWPIKKREPLEAWLDELQELKNNSSIHLKTKELPSFLLTYLSIFKDLDNFSGIQMRLPHIYKVD